MNHPGLGPNHPTNQDDEVFQTLDFFLRATFFSFHPGIILAIILATMSYHPGIILVCCLDYHLGGHHPTRMLLSSWLRAGALVFFGPHHPGVILPPTGAITLPPASWCPRGVIILASSWPAWVVTPSSWRHPGRAAAEKVKILKSWLLEVWPSIILGL